MKFLVGLAVFVVAFLHFGFMALEMFYWDHPIGQDVFDMTPEQSAFSAALAANQGFYNGFIGLGLVWGQMTRRRDVVVLFLLFVVAAGVFGAMTAKFTIIYTQALPAVIALILMALSRRTQWRLF